MASIYFTTIIGITTLITVNAIYVIYVKATKSVDLEERIEKLENANEELRMQRDVTLFNNIARRTNMANVTEDEALSSMNDFKMPKSKKDYSHLYATKHHTEHNTPLL